MMRKISILKITSIMQPTITTDMIMMSGDPAEGPDCTSVTGMKGSVGVVSDVCVVLEKSVVCAVEREEVELASDVVVLLVLSTVPLVLSASIVVEPGSVGGGVCS